MTNLVKVSSTQQILVKEVETNAIKLITPGPQGPQALLPATLIDASTAGTIYVGSAPAGSQEASAVWNITRNIYNASGVRTSKGIATSVTWTGRATHTYAP